MSYRDDYDLSEWRRRAHRGSRDIAIAVALTILTIGTLGVAWHGNSRHDSAMDEASVDLRLR